MRIIKNYFKNKAIVIFIFLLMSSLMFGQTGSIKGKVLDKDSKTPLTGANVIIQGTTLGAAMPEKHEESSFPNE